MTDAPSSVRDSRSDAATTRSEPDENGDGSRRLAVAGIGITVLSAVVSALSYGYLPDRMRIHWTLGAGPYYGPEFAPTPAVLIGFPALIAGIAISAYAVDTRLRRREGVAAVRPYYGAGLVGTLGVLLAAQAALVLVAV